jgi:hypothetical protein
LPATLVIQSSGLCHPGFDHGRHAHRYRIRRHVLDYDGIGADTGTVTNYHFAKDLGACAENLMRIL